ncbi:MAG: MFS transporter [Candidatus Kapaibacterium sp.]
MNQANLGRNFNIYAIGKLVSMVGSGIQQVAIPLFILDLTGSGTLMGIFAMLSTIPGIVISPIAGAMGDRLDRKRIMVYTDFIRGLIILFLALVVATGDITIIILFICQVFVSINDSFFNASTQAMLPELVEQKELTRANSMIGGINSFSLILGPALGGILYAAVGMEGVFLVNGVSFVGSAISELFLKYKPAIAGKLEWNRVWGDIRVGMRAILDMHAIRQLIIYGGFLNFLFLPFIIVLLPYVLRQDIGFSAHEYGFLQSFWMVGVLVGNLILGVRFAHRSTAGAMKNGFTFMIIFNTLFAILIYIFNEKILPLNMWEMFVGVALLLTLMGLFNAFINTPLMTNLQLLVPADVRARAFSLLMALFQSAVPIGMVVFGFLTDNVPISYILLAMSAVLLVGTLIFMRSARPEVFEPPAPQN